MIAKPLMGETVYDREQPSRCGVFNRWMNKGTYALVIKPKTADRYYIKAAQVVIQDSRGGDRTKSKKAGESAQ